MLLIISVETPISGPRAQEIEVTIGGGGRDSGGVADGFVGEIDESEICGWLYNCRLPV